MSSRAFFLRLILPFAVLMSLIIVVCGAAIYFVGERRTRQQQVADLDRLTPLVRQWAAESPTLDDAGRRRLADAARVLRARITLVGGDGTVLLDTDADAARMENHNNRPEVQAARRSGTGSGVRFSRTLDERAVYVAQLLDPNDPAGTVVRVSYPQHTWTDLGNSAWAIVALGIVAALVALAVLWGMLQWQWITPTRRLAEAAERLAAGDWGERAAPAGADELRAFSGRLNLV